MADGGYSTTGEISHMDIESDKGKKGGQKLENPQIGRNLEAYVDDMVIKSNDEKMLLAGVAKTFDGLRRINMKLNMKKCSFGVEEGKFLGYMVTFKGIQANQKKTKAIADMQSPQTLKEMKSLSGKLAALNRFLAWSAERSLPFFDTLKIITKENKDEYQTLDESERNYAPLEKLALSLLHMSRRLRRAKEKDTTKKWTLFTNGASNSKGSGAGLVLISPSGIEFTYALRLNFTSTNNEAEYKALLARLRLAAKMQVQAIDVKNEARALRMKINQYVMEGGIPFKKGYLVPMMRCVGPLQANYVIREIQIGACGMNYGTRSVVANIIRQGYYWPTMHRDARNEIQKCDSCQIQPVPKLPKNLMTSIMDLWPFYQWGIDILGPLSESAEKVKFVILAIDYFTKWIEAKPLERIIGKEGKNFL
ncbi:reverse transcriptase domain-containing protein [Tanacetum coccineum]